MPMDTIGAVRPMLKPDMEALVKVTGPGGSYGHGGGRGALIDTIISKGRGIG